jgi:orotidine-5'-phosphate decarboxylase
MTASCSRYDSTFDKLDNSSAERKTVRHMSRLIIALDVPTLNKARSLVEMLSPLDVIFKVGYEAYYGFGPALLDVLEACNAEIFLDLKLHDIPRTAAAAMHSLLRPRISIVTVHAAGGEEMMRSVVEAAETYAVEHGIKPAAIFGVTILTSIAPIQLEEMGFTGGMGENVVRLAALARNAGCAGVVCSTLEAGELKNFFGHEFMALCPGIRPIGSAPGDQQRVATPAQAVAAGVDYLVVGRPITEAADPYAVARAVLDEMRSLS